MVPSSRTRYESDRARSWWGTREEAASQLREPSGFECQRKRRRDKCNYATWRVRLIDAHKDLNGRGGGRGQVPKLSSGSGGFEC